MANIQRFDSTKDPDTMPEYMKADNSELPQLRSMPEQFAPSGFIEGRYSANSETAGKSSKSKLAVVAGGAALIAAGAAIAYGAGNEPGGVTPNPDQVRVASEAVNQTGEQLPENPADLVITVPGAESDK